LVTAQVVSIGQYVVESLLTFKKEYKKAAVFNIRKKLKTLFKVKKM